MSTIAACYLGLVLCTDAVYRPPPRIIVVPGDGFPCGDLCYDPPVCHDVRPARCNGEYRHGKIIVSYGTLNAIPHELLHHLARGHHDDGSHEGWPWTRHCDRRGAVPACDPLWEVR